METQSKAPGNSRAEMSAHRARRRAHAGRCIAEGGGRRECLASASNGTRLQAVALRHAAVGSLAERSSISSARGNRRPLGKIGVQTPEEQARETLRGHRVV